MDLRESVSATTPSEVVEFDQLTPTTGGVVFTPNTPATTNVLYVSTVNASTWIYNGSSYVTYTAATLPNTPFYLLGTTIDAGGNKTAAIQHLGPLRATTLTGNGINITGINAANLETGVVSVNRLGSSGTRDNTTFLRGDNTWATAGLTNFIEAQSTSSPNATVNVDSLTAVASTTDADISIVPKGNGAFQLAVPDNTIVGGNKRGLNSVDLQTASRSSANQVASGNYVSLLGGYRNRATGNYSVTAGNQNLASGQSSVALGELLTASAIGSVGLGVSCTSSGSYSFSSGLQSTSTNSYAVAMGYLCTASGQSSVSLGASNTASGLYSVSIGYGNNNTGTYGALATGWTNTMSSTGGFVGGYSCNHSGSYGLTMGYQSSNSGAQTIVIGQSITSSDQYSIVVGTGSSITGGSYTSAFGKGAKALNAGGRNIIAYNNTVAGDAQNNKLILSKRTTDATLTPLTVGGGVPYFGQNEFTLQDNSCVRFNGTIVGKKTATAQIGVWDIDGVISKISGTVTINVNNVTLVLNASGWGTPTLTVNGSYGLSINVVGLAGTNIQWTCYLDATEVVY